MKIPCRSLGKQGFEGSTDNATGQKKPPSQRRLWVPLLFLFVGTLIALITLASRPEVPINRQPSRTEKPGAGLSGDMNLLGGRFELVEAMEETREMSPVYISGTLKNTGDIPYSYAQVTFNLYDADGNQIGTAVDSISNWDAGGCWKFNALGLIRKSEEMDSFRLVDITAF